MSRSGVATSLVIESSPLHHLELTSNLFKRLGLDLANLRMIRIVNTTLQSINICQKEEGEDNLIACSSLSSLRLLDLRDNQLSSLTEFSLDGLEEIYLSGNDRRLRKNMGISRFFWPMFLIWAFFAEQERPLGLMLRHTINLRDKPRHAAQLSLIRL